MKARFTGNGLGAINLDRGDHYHNPYPKGFGPVTVPEGSSGRWKVQRFTVTEEKVGLYNLRLIRDGQRHRVVPPGNYTRLVRDSTVVMSDTPAEAHEHLELYSKAKGRVLLNGLGLGFALTALLSKEEVVHITVVEKSTDVVKLVAPHFRSEKVKVMRADALTWRPDKGTKFDVVWHDIWDTICTDNKGQMSSLKQAYKKVAAWQACWSESYFRDMRY